MSLISHEHPDPKPILSPTGWRHASQGSSPSRTGGPRVRAVVAALLAMLPNVLPPALPIVVAWSALAVLGAVPALAGEVLVATRTLRAATPINAGDVALVTGRVPPGAATDPEQAVGKEARVTLYAGRPIPLASLAPAAMVERNQIVLLVFRHGGLDIRAEGRALGRAGEGERVRVMNLASRNTVTGEVLAAGIVAVAP